MKTIQTTLILLCSLSWFLSCSNEEGNGVMPPETNTPVSLTLSASLDIQTHSANNGYLHTKAGIAEDRYTAEAIYLMVQDPSAAEGWTPYPMILQKNGNAARFTMNIVAFSSDRIFIDNGVDEPIEINSYTRLIFSSTPQITIQAETDNDKLTPDGNPTLKPYGENLFRSENFAIIPWANGIYLLGNSFTDGEEIVFTLDMFRQTGLLEVNLVLFRKTEDNPSHITAGHFKPDCAEVDYWQITPYLNGYTGTFRMDRDPVDPSVVGVYMLSNGILPFEERNISIPIGEDELFDCKTHGAFTDATPYLFSGLLSGASLDFLITNTKPAVPESRIATIALHENEKLDLNERRTINVFMNITVLEANFTDNKLKATPLTSDNKETLPDIFYTVE